MKPTEPKAKRGPKPKPDAQRLTLKIWVSPATMANIDAKRGKRSRSAYVAEKLGPPE